MLTTIPNAAAGSLLGASFSQGSLYGTSFIDPASFFSSVGRINEYSGAYTPLAYGSEFLNSYGLATEESSGTLYSILNTFNGGTPVSRILASIDSDGTVTMIGESGIDGRGMAYDDANGILYATHFTGDLYTVNTSSGVATLIGNMGILAHNAGLAYDEDNDILYLNVTKDPSNQYHSLYTINVSTGAATLVGANGTPEIAGLAWIDSPLPPAQMIYGSQIGGLWSINLDAQSAAQIDTFGSGLGFNLSRGADDDTLYTTNGSSLTDLYKYTISTGALTPIAFDLAQGPALGWRNDFLLYGKDNQTYAVDPSTGNETLLGNAAQDYSGDLATDDLGVVYGSTINGNLVVVDPTTGAQQIVGFMGVQVYGLAFSEDGRLWGADAFSSDIYEIDKMTAGVTLAFSAGVQFSDLASVPEPAALHLIGAGAALLMLIGRRRVSESNFRVIEPTPRPSPTPPA